MIRKNVLNVERYIGDEIMLCEECLEDGEEVELEELEECVVRCPECGANYNYDVQS